DLPAGSRCRNASERPLIAAARDERLAMPAMNFDDVRSRGMIVDGAQQTVTPRRWNERVAATKDKEAVGRKMAEVLCWMRAQECLSVVRKPVAFVHRS